MWLIDYTNNLYNQKWFFNRHQNVRRSVDRQRACKIMVKKVANNMIEMTIFTEIFVKYFEKKNIYVDQIRFLKL